MFVKLLSNSAAPVANVDATSIPVITMTIAISFWIFVPRYFEMIPGIVIPSFLRERNPEKKSCIAPMKMVPRVIHRNAAGPNNAPCMAPNMGPNPAMFKKCTKNALYFGIGM